MTKRPLAFLVSLLLTGCSLAPDYQRPESPVPASYPKGCCPTTAPVGLSLI